MQNNLSQCNASFFVKYLKNFIVFISICIATELSALPVLDGITNGEASVLQVRDFLQVEQTTEKAIINWESFNVAVNESVHFVQPDKGVCLSRINELNGLSHIDGALTATGKIYLINPAGIAFGNTARVNVGGIIASAIDISDQNFLDNKHIFDKAGNHLGAIVNRGVIDADVHGTVALLGANVVNDGVIIARVGNVLLGSGSKFTIDFLGDQVINFAVDPTQTHALDEFGNKLANSIDNSGKIFNDGGFVFVSAKATKECIDNIINMDGVVQAKTMSQRAGTIILTGDENSKINIEGTLDLSGDVNNRGGVVLGIAGDINVTENATIDVSGKNGGKIFLGDVINLFGANTNSVHVAKDALLKADAIDNGNAGDIRIMSQKETQFSGNAFARGGDISGDGGIVEISTNGVLKYEESLAHVETTAKNGNTGTLLFDPKFLIVQTGGNPYLNNLNNLYTNSPTATTILTPASIVNAAQTNNIRLQANSDIIFNGNLILVSNGKSLTVNAGRSVLFNANVTTVNGAFIVTANDSTAQSANRSTITTGNPVGDNEAVLGNITMSTGTALTAGTGSISLTVGTSTTSPYSPGDITYENLSGGAISLSTPNTINGGDIVTSGGVTLSAGTISNITGVISGAGGLIKNGNGTLLLSSANTYTGATTVNAGILKAGIADAITTSSSLSLTNTAGAAFDLNGFNQTIGTLVGGGAAGGNITLSGANLTVTQGANNNYSGIISGTGDVIKEGSGMLTLIGANTYTGTTLINHGTLRTNAANVLPSTTNVILANDVSAILNLANSNQTIASLAGGGINGGNISLGSATLTVAQATNDTYSGEISGTGGITLNGPATLTLGGTNIYTGTTTISQGTLRADKSNVINGSPLVIASGATFDLNDFDQSIGTLSGSGSISLNTATLTVNQATLNTFAGVISGYGNLVKNGSATLLLSGANTYSGLTTINAGKIQTGSANVLNSSLSLSNTSGVIFDLDGYSQTIKTLSGGGTTGGNINLGAATLTVLQDANNVYGGIISGAGGVTVNGSAILNLTGTNTYTGQTTINAGVLQAGASNVLANNSAVVLANNTAVFDLNDFAQSIGSLSGGGNVGGSVDLGNATLTINQTSNDTFAGVISGSGGISKYGSSRLTLSGDNTYTGATNVFAGTLQAGAVDIIADSSGLIMANVAGAAFDLNNFDQTIKNLSGGGGSGGNITLGSAIFTIQQDNIANYAGVISGSGDVILNGTGTLTLSGPNTYTGQTTISAGTLKAGNPFVLAESSALHIDNASATFDLNNFDQTIGSLSGGGVSGGAILLNNGVLTISQTTPGTYAGTINGNGNIVLANTSTSPLILTGVNTYSGITALNGGKLQVSSDGNLGSVPGTFDANSIKFNGGILSVDNSFTLNANRGVNVDVNGGYIEVSPTMALTYNGVIAGSGPLYKSGTGSVVLGGVNTYTGTTNILAGTLQTTIANSIANTSSLVLANNASANFDVNGFNQTIGSLSGGGATGGNIELGAGNLVVNQGVNNSYAGIISGTGSLQKEGSARLTLIGNNTYTGATIVNAGTLQAGGANVIPVASAVNLANVSTAKFDLNDFNQSINSLTGGGNLGGNVTLGSATLTINQSNPAVYAGIISGNGNIVKEGVATLTLSGINTYTGDTTINAGSLQAGVANTISSSNKITIADVASAAFDLNGYAQEINNLAGGGASGGNIALGANLSITQSTNNTYAGSITGNGNVNLNGSAVLILSGANTYTGAININSGTLRMGATNVLPSTTSVVLANTIGTTFDLNNYSQTIGTLSGGGSTGGNIALGSGTLTVTQASNATYAGIISGSGSIVKDGAAILTLSGTNTYTGTTTIQNGTLRAGSLNNLASSNAFVLVDTSGAAFDLGGYNQTIGSLSGGGTAGGNILLGSATLLINQTAPQSFAGIISGSGNVVLTTGSTSTLTLNGNNTYTGTTSVRAGKLKINNDNNLGVAPISPATNYLNLNGGTLEVSGSFVLNANRGATLGVNNGSIVVEAGQTLTYDGIIAGSGTLTKKESGTLILGGNNTYTGATFVEGGVLRTNIDNAIANSSSLTLSDVSSVGFDLNSFNQNISTLAGGGTSGGNITLGSATLTISQTNNSNYAGIISGTGDITKSGSATLTLNGVSTYTGATRINQGILRAGGANIFANSTPMIIANATGATFDLNNYEQTIGALSGGGVSGGNILLGNATLTVSQNIPGTYAGIISGSGDVTLDGTSILALQGMNTYSGTTSIVAGTLQAGDNNVIANSSGLVLADNATANFDLNDFDQSIGNLAGGGNAGGDVLLGSATITINQTNDASYAGNIRDFTGGNVVVNGSATLTLSGDNTYTGTTTINSGVVKAGHVNIIPNSSALILANSTGAAFDLNGFNQNIGTLVGGGGAGGNVLLGNATLTINLQDNSSYAGVISGDGNVIKAGPYGLNLGNVNTYTGLTEISEGMLQAGAINTISSSTPITIEPYAVFDLNGYNQSLNTVIGNNGGTPNVLLDGAILQVANAIDLVISP